MTEKPFSLDFDRLGAVNKNVVVRVIIPRSYYEDMKHLADVSMVRKIAEVGEYVVVDVDVVRVKKNKVLVNLLGYLFIVKALE